MPYPPFSWNSPGVKAVNCLAQLFDLNSIYRYFLVIFITSELLEVEVT